MRRLEQSAALTPSIGGFYFGLRAGCGVLGSPVQPPEPACVAGGRKSGKGREHGVPGQEGGGMDEAMAEWNSWPWPQEWRLPEP